MPIRDVVTRGFSNGTFTPGVSKVATRGYSISTVVVVPGPYCIVAVQLSVLGAAEAQTNVLGAEQIESSMLRADEVEVCA